MICPKCGLPKAACVCEAIAREEAHIRIRSEKKKFGKIVTIVEGFTKDVNVKDIARQLKTKLACGGTIKNDAIELQGNHRTPVRNMLIELGFPAETISG